MSDELDLNSPVGRALARSLGFLVPPEADGSEPLPQHDTHTLIYAALLPRLNEVRGRKWYAEHAKKKQLANDFALLARIQNVPKATTRRSVSLAVTLGPRRKKPDADAYDKLLLDALVRCDLLLDDSARGLVGRVEVSFERGTKDETRITLEDVE